ncbi:hypothetical protein Bca4012_010694 [Brassica carinata]
MATVRCWSRCLLQHGSISPVAMRRLEEWCEWKVKRGLFVGFRRRCAAKFLIDGVVNWRRGLWWQDMVELVLPSSGVTGGTDNAPLEAVTRCSNLVDVVKARFSFRIRCSVYGIGSGW